jgi:hypothetical protein
MAVSRMAGIQGAEGRLLLSARNNKRYTWVPGVNYVRRYVYRIVALQVGRAGAGGHHLRPWMANAGTANKEPMDSPVRGENTLATGEPSEELLCLFRPTSSTTP